MFVKMCPSINYPFKNIKRVLLLTLMATLSILTVMYKNSSRLLTTNKKVSRDISCHYVTEDEDENALPSAEDITPRPDSIFFHETSCRGGLNSRQACAVESAARLHQKRDVYVFFNSPIQKFMLDMSCLSILTQLPNVRLARLHTVEYGQDTVLGEMLALKNNSRTPWPVEHTADLLRFLTMHKYGGIYLDTDMIVVKPLDDLGKNWAGRESSGIVNNAAMAFGNDYIGRNLTSIILNEIKENFQPNKWAHNGAGALVRSLSKFCNTSVVTEMSAANCQGFQVYEPRTFYAMPWIASSIYFEKGVLPHIIAFNKDKVYAYHLWNNISKENKLENNSPFDKLARKYCPSIRWAYGNKFGT